MKLKKKLGGSYMKIPKIPFPKEPYLWIYRLLSLAIATCFIAAFFFDISVKNMLLLIILLSVLKDWAYEAERKAYKKRMEK